MTGAVGAYLPQAHHGSLDLLLGLTVTLPGHLHCEDLGGLGHQQMLHMVPDSTPACAKNTDCLKTRGRIAQASASQQV